MSLAGVKSPQPSVLREWQDAALQDMLATTKGRRVLSMIIKDLARFEESSFSIEARHTEFREGQRSIAIDLIKRIRNLDPDGWIKIQTERNADERTSR